ncbi:MAG TPA: nuclear transport factor 2 family protein [Solimonas sp.]|nr:nuclear transport factor 2 family protein [Solimonas sp.]
MNLQQAKDFVTRWLDAANSHELEQIMSFYAPDAVVESPFVVELMNEPTGRIKGEAALRAYFGKGVKTYSLHLIEAAWGANSISAWYANNKGTRTHAYLEIGKDGKITRNVSHYNA